MLPKNRIKSIRSSRNVLLAALVIIGAITIYNWFVAPPANYLWAVQRYNSVAGDLAKKNQLISKNIAIKKNKFGELHEKFKHVHTKLFDPIKAKGFFSDIQVVSEEANCVVLSLKFSSTASMLKADPSEKNSYITAQRANLTAKGTYVDITALMNKLQDRLEQVRIDSISIKTTRGNSGQLICDMNITIYVMQNKERGSYD
ncbi:MAG: hypothetical protein FVQ85_11560 [Planctomycetes bacterium]|nr:hypothetical protein [Planctomycetota bacterium]